MDEIKSALCSVFTISLVSAAAAMLYPDDGKERKYLNLLFGLVILIVLTAPLSNVISAASSLVSGIDAILTEPDETTAESEDDAYDLLVRSGSDSICAFVLSELEKAFGDDIKGATVTAVLDSGDLGNIKVTSLTICLASPPVNAGCDDIALYAGGLLGCEAEVTWSGREDG